ncbi:kinase-like protein [Xylona heveae TC161]|uniref:non-specific serine/threonine protein kinase n=1 Tax=Xylona heveae (strain CBS 132557 / TC161) TaxID=1328760 RepID=A0A165G702_XYLHT|nr:kinase-like protein [Xylona heveae TC161]KZF21812.1 kinase-like protein [Xylona heveae TC161]
MASVVQGQPATDPFIVHEPQQDAIGEWTETKSLDQTARSNEEFDSDQESYLSEGSDEFVDQSVLDDMEKFEETFKGITKRFRLINRIGEGTFSTVYKAEDLLYDHYVNEWDLEEKEDQKWFSPPVKRRRTDDAGYSVANERARRRRGPRYVAIKKIYVTSSPMRIQNELELLHDLRGCESVCPLITAFRHQDQVVAVLPYFRHVDFREYFRDFTVPDMRVYFRSLFAALAAVHEHEILHRDIKPTNFLYDIYRERGVLVDFGLAEREGTDWAPCICQDHPQERRERIASSVAAQQGAATGYPKNDQRNSRRANRAGTRGFRAPEVLLKCPSQTTKIDIWSAGVILLTILARRFPFFHSADDIDAMIEIATIFGAKRMRACALLHGTVFEANIPTIGERGFSFEKIILWSTSRSGKREDGREETLSADEQQAVRFLQRCMELDPEKRISAEEALRHEFLAGAGESAAEDDEVEML